MAMPLPPALQKLLPPLQQQTPVLVPVQPTAPSTKVTYVPVSQPPASTPSSSSGGGTTQTTPLVNLTGGTLNDRVITGPGYVPIAPTITVSPDVLASASQNRNTSPVLTTEPKTGIIPIGGPAKEERFYPELTYEQKKQGYEYITPMQYQEEQAKSKIDAIRGVYQARKQIDILNRMEEKFKPFKPYYEYSGGPLVTDPFIFYNEKGETITRMQAADLIRQGKIDVRRYQFSNVNALKSPVDISTSWDPETKVLKSPEGSYQVFFPYKGAQYYKEYSNIVSSHPELTALRLAEGGGNLFGIIPTLNVDLALQTKEQRERTLIKELHAKKGSPSGGPTWQGLGGAIITNPWVQIAGTAGVSLAAGKAFQVGSKYAMNKAIPSLISKFPRAGKAIDIIGGKIITKEGPSEIYSNFVRYAKTGGKVIKRDISLLRDETKSFILPINENMAIVKTVWSPITPRYGIKYAESIGVATSKKIESEGIEVGYKLIQKGSPVNLVGKFGNKTPGFDIVYNWDKSMIVNKKGLVSFIEPLATKKTAIVEGFKHIIPFKYSQVGMAKSGESLITSKGFGIISKKVVPDFVLMDESNVAARIASERSFMFSKGEYVITNPFKKRIVVGEIKTAADIHVLQQGALGGVTKKGSGIISGEVMDSGSLRFAQRLKFDMQSRGDVFGSVIAQRFGESEASASLISIPRSIGSVVVTRPVISTVSNRPSVSRLQPDIIKISPQSIGESSLFSKVGITTGRQEQKSILDVGKLDFVSPITGTIVRQGIIQTPVKVTDIVTDMDKLTELKLSKVTTNVPQKSIVSLGFPVMVPFFSPLKGGREDQLSPDTWGMYYRKRRFGVLNPMQIVGQNNRKSVINQKHSNVFKRRK